MWRKSFYALSSIILIATIQVISGILFISWIGLVIGGLQSLLSDLLWLWITTSRRDRKTWYVSGGIAVVGIILGGAFRYLFVETTGNYWLFDGFSGLAALFTTGFSAAWQIRSNRNPEKGCNICGFQNSESLITCPRCGHTVCSDCWNIKLCRCSDCHRLQRPLLRLKDEKWWARQLGPRVERGQCYRCHKEAIECDLRRCGRCTKSLCSHCWDFENGSCIRCGWTIPDLPQSLRPIKSEESVRQRTPY